MTNIIPKKNKIDLGRLPEVTDDDQNRRMLGMADAGKEINTWMIDTDGEDPLAEEFFDDLFDKLNGSADNKNRFFIDVTNQMGQPMEKKINAGGKGYRFRLDGKRHKLKIKCDEDETDIKRNVKMVIGVPEKRGNLLSGGYLSKIHSDLKEFFDAGKNDEAKQYLLGVIFLNRCQ